MTNPFRHDPHPNLTKAIGDIVNESQTRAQLEKMSITRLRELQKKYAALVVKGDRDASRELADIRGILRSRGAGVAVDEGVSPQPATRDNEKKDKPKETGAEAPKPKPKPKHSDRGYPRLYGHDGT